MSKSMRTYIIAPTVERARRVCDERNIPPRGKNTCIITGEMAGRGCRIEPSDRVIVIRDGWKPERWEAVRTVMAPAGLVL